MIFSRWTWLVGLAALISSSVFGGEPLGRAVGSAQFAVNPDWSSWLRRTILSSGEEVPLGTWSMGSFEAPALGGLLKPAGEPEFEPVPPSIVDRLVAPATFPDQLDLVERGTTELKPPVLTPDAKEKQLVRLVEKFNDLMNANRFDDAYAVALEARKLVPDSPVVENMSWKSRYAKAIAGNMPAWERQKIFGLAFHEAPAEQPEQEAKTPGKTIADLSKPTAPATQPSSSPSASPAPQTEDNAGTDDVKPNSEPAPGKEDKTPSAEKAESLKDMPLLPADERVARRLDDTFSRPEPPPADAPLTPEMQELRTKLRKCLDTYYRQQITNGEYSPWGIMHVLIGYGCDSEIYAADHRVSTAGWLCWNGSCRGMRLLYSAEGGSFAVRQGAGYQGHPGQLLAILAQSRVAIDYEMRVDGKKYTVADLIEYEKKTCREKTELTFKLIGLSHYLSPDATWKDDRGVEWSIQKLIKEELAQPINGAACGGCHRLTGLAYAVRNRERAGGEINGQWLRARKYLNDYHAYTFKLQNPDGSFSANWFEGRGQSDEIGRRLQTTGHILEWLVYSLPAEELDDPRVVKAVNVLVELMQANSKHKWEIGPRGHAIHALNIYDRRRFGAKMGERSVIARAAPKGASTVQTPGTSGSSVREQLPSVATQPTPSAPPAIESNPSGTEIPSTADRPRGSMRLRR